MALDEVRNEIMICPWVREGGAEMGRLDEDIRFARRRGR
jgi:hypothetical protein